MITSLPFPPISPSALVAVLVHAISDVISAAQIRGERGEGGTLRAVIKWAIGFQARAWVPSCLTESREFISYSRVP